MGNVAEEIDEPLTAEDFRYCCITQDLFLSCDQRVPTFTGYLRSEIVSSAITGHNGEKWTPRLCYARISFERPELLDALLELFDQLAVPDTEAFFKKIEEGADLFSPPGGKVSIELVPHTGTELFREALRPNATEIASMLLVSPEGREGLEKIRRELHAWLRHASAFVPGLPYRPEVIADDASSSYVVRDGEVGYGYNFGLIAATTHSDDPYRFSIALDADYSEEFEYPREEADPDDEEDTWRVDLHFLTLRLTHLEDLEAAVRMIEGGQLDFAAGETPHQRVATHTLMHEEPKHVIQVSINERVTPECEARWLPIKAKDEYYAEHLQFVLRKLSDGNLATALREVAKIPMGWVLAVRSLSYLSGNDALASMA